MHATPRVGEAVHTFMYFLVWGFGGGLSKVRARDRKYIWRAIAKKSPYEKDALLVAHNHPVALFSRPKGIDPMLASQQTEGKGVKCKPAPSVCVSPSYRANTPKPQLSRERPYLHVPFCSRVLTASLPHCKKGTPFWPYKKKVAAVCSAVLPHRTQTSPIPSGPSCPSSAPASQPQPPLHSQIPHSHPKGGQHFFFLIFYFSTLFFHKQITARACAEQPHYEEPHL